MKIYLLLILVPLFLISNVIAQQKYKDNIVSDISSYAGVYEGNLDVSLCCGSYGTGFGTIVFYYDGVSLKCLYDGLIYENMSLIANVVKSSYSNEGGLIFGKFVKDKEDGFLYYFEESDEHPEGSTSFLKRIGDSESASKIYLSEEKAFKDFKEVEKVFRKAIDNKNEKDILSMINVPFYDKRESLDNPKELDNSNDIRVLIKTMFQEKLIENGFFKNQNSDNDFGGTYTMNSFNMTFYFKKIGTEFKMIYITKVFG